MRHDAQQSLNSNGRSARERSGRSRFGPEVVAAGSGAREGEVSSGERENVKLIVAVIMGG